MKTDFNSIFGLLLCISGMLILIFVNKISQRVVKIYARDSSDSEKKRTYTYEFWRLILISIALIIFGLVMMNQ